MNIIARQNTLLKCMKKNEVRQDWNRWFFILSLGAVLHSLSCINTPKKLNTIDYVGIPACAITLKRVFSLQKKEKRGLELWQTLQHKAAHQT